MDSIRSFHRDLKRQLIMDWLPGKSVLDIGAGFMGPVHAFEKAQVSFIFGIEPDEKHIKEAESRIAKKPQSFQRQIHLWHGGAENTKGVLQEFARCRLQKLDAAVSFFSLTFFFQSQEMLVALLNTIAATVHRRGYFLGTTMDGEATEQFLSNLKCGETVEEKGIYSIQKNYCPDDADADGVFGKEIEIHLFGGTIVEKQTEYLVHFPTLQKLVEEKLNMTLVASEMFAGASAFSCLNRWFVFVKRECQ